MGDDARTVDVDVDLSAEERAALPLLAQGAALRFTLGL